jgi:hypothetical protein
MTELRHMLVINTRPTGKWQSQTNHVWICNFQIDEIETELCHGSREAIMYQSLTPIVQLVAVSIFARPANCDKIVSLVTLRQCRDCFIALTGVGRAALPRS